MVCTEKKFKYITNKANYEVGFFIYFFPVCFIFFWGGLFFVYAVNSEHYWDRSLWQHCQELEKMYNLSDEFQFSSHMTVLCLFA